MNAKKSTPAKRAYEREDEGFFGPGSVAWKVWSTPLQHIRASPKQ